MLMVLYIAITISWDVPSMPNGIITAYEIHYTNGSGTYNTTNTQYTIEGLLPNTLYTIEVRAYTSAGAGEWSEYGRIYTCHM